MKNIMMITGVIAVAATMSGCATILKGKTQQVNIATSNQQKIDVNIDGKTVSVPGVVEVTRKKANLMVTTKAEGCTESTVVENEVEPVFFVNILSGGVFGSTTDYSSESMWKYDQNIVINCK